MQCIICGKDSTNPWTNKAEAICNTCHREKRKKASRTTYFFEKLKDIINNDNLGKSPTFQDKPINSTFKRLPCISCGLEYWEDDDGIDIFGDSTCLHCESNQTDEIISSGIKHLESIYGFSPLDRNFNNLYTDDLQQTAYSEKLISDLIGEGFHPLHSRFAPLNLYNPEKILQDLQLESTYKKIKYPEVITPSDSFIKVREIIDTRLTEPDDCLTLDIISGLKEGDNTSTFIINNFDDIGEYPINLANIQHAIDNFPPPPLKPKIPEKSLNNSSLNLLSWLFMDAHKYRAIKDIEDEKTEAEELDAQTAPDVIHFALTLYWIIRRTKLISMKNLNERYKKEWNKLREENRRIKLLLSEITNNQQWYKLSDWWNLLVIKYFGISSFPKNHKSHYNHLSNELIFNLDFPNFHDLEIFKLKGYTSGWRYISVNQKENKTAIETIFFLYPIRLAFELAKILPNKKVNSIVINSMCRKPDPTTGQERTYCLSSVRFPLENMTSINIDHIDPAALFKHFKGSYAGKPEQMIETVPLITFNDDESRFVEALSIAKEEINSNLAAMDWENFEHLIRELFEMEFSTQNGAEVKITKASRDKGVDAIAFDPSPISGGKYIIQAKRYTNIVDVSAVRDLYGTTINEGANRGILVTTSHFGPDAYNFASDKPITLINGSELISLLSKHNLDYYIDIPEAKRLLNP